MSRKQKEKPPTKGASWSTGDSVSRTMAARWSVLTATTMAGVKFRRGSTFSLPVARTWLCSIRSTSRYLREPRRCAPEFIYCSTRTLVRSMHR